MINMTVADVLLNRAPDGVYEDDYFVYTVKNGQVMMTGKPFKTPFVYSEESLR